MGLGIGYDVLDQQVVPGGGGGKDAPDDTHFAIVLHTTHTCKVGPLDMRVKQSRWDEVKSVQVVSLRVECRLRDCGAGSDIRHNSSGPGNGQCWVQAYQITCGTWRS